LVEQSQRIVVSSCFGGHWECVERWADHTHFKCRLPIHIVSVDGDRLQDDFGEGRFVHPPPAPSKSPLDALAYRLDFIVDKLGSGISCAQVDLDVLVTRNIGDLFDIDADFIASRAFRLPDFMAAAFGYVACLGFFIAKPPAVELCLEIANAMRDRRYEDETGLGLIDQYVVNKIFFDEILAGAMKPFTQTAPPTDAFEPYLISEYRGTRVAILGPNTIVRGDNLGRARHGIHHPSVISLFRPD
jgi:hypothetical protein